MHLRGERSYGFHLLVQGSRPDSGSYSRGQQGARANAGRAPRAELMSRAIDTPAIRRPRGHS